MEITIPLTDHQMAVFAHKHIDVTAFAAELVRAEADKDSRYLAEGLVRNALDVPSKEPMIMDRDSIVDAMFNEAGYKNAAEREAEAIANAEPPAS